MDEIVGPAAKIVWIFNARVFLDRQSPALMSLMRLAPEELISPEQVGFSVNVVYRVKIHLFKEDCANLQK